MAVFNAAFPVLPGKVDVARKFAKEVLGARSVQFEEVQRRQGVTRVTWSIQHNPDGSAFSVVWFESSDPGKALLETALDDSEFGVWFRDRVKEINGVELDPSQPLADLSELTLDWRASTVGPEHGAG